MTRQEIPMPASVYGPAILSEEVRRFQPDSRESVSGRRSEILLKTDDLRVVLVTLRAGAELAEHSAPGTITIQGLEGDLIVEVDGSAHDLPAGSIVSLAAGTRHAVRARTDGAFLLTIAWAGRSAG
jgi:quercetin dioxygenase-like cupin family protein